MRIVGTSAARGVAEALLNSILECRDSDGEFFPDDVLEEAFNILVGYGYLMRCDQCASDGFENAYYNPDDGECYRGHGPEEDDDEECQCEDCVESRKAAEEAEADPWGVNV